MEDELFAKVYRILKFITTGRGKYQQFGDAEIVATYFWAVVHDRPTNWACSAGHWSQQHRWRSLPSPSTMSRRLRTHSVQELMQRVPRHVARCFPKSFCKLIDSKPLCVGSWSTDRQAAWGQAGKAKGKGYKLHAICDRGGFIHAWDIAPMNVSELHVAQRLIPQHPVGGYLLGDSQYDSNALYETAAKYDYQLVAPRKKPRRSLGHRPHSAHRLRSIDLLEGGSRFGRQLYKARTSVERCFGQMGNFACGLSPLPNWVRTQARVGRWVQAKILLHHLRLLKKQRLTA